MKNKGFTIVELLAVIVVLAILILVAVPNITGIIQSSSNQANTIMEDNLKEAAILYAQSTKGIGIKDCSVVVNKGNYEDQKDQAKCLTGIKVMELIGKGMFSDAKGNCDANAIVYYYNYKKATCKAQYPTCQTEQGKTGWDASKVEYTKTVYAYVVPGTCTGK